MIFVQIRQLAQRLIRSNKRTEEKLKIWKNLLRDFLPMLPNPSVPPRKNWLNNHEDITPSVVAILLGFVKSARQEINSYAWKD